MTVLISSVKGVQWMMTLWETATKERGLFPHWDEKKKENKKKENKKKRK